MSDKKLYFIRVLTPLHVGTGTGLRHIDLPIYREAHTDFPCIPSSAIKGVFRTEKIRELAENEKKKATEIEKEIEEYDDKKESDKDIYELIEKFGSKNREGSVVFTDARILFFPVKSLKGIFALITCPYVLKRFKEDTDRDLININEQLSENECYVHSGSAVEVERDRLVVLEEFTFKVKGNRDFGNLRNVNKERIVIVHDNIFTHMVKTYTEIQTHIKVDIEKGTVERGNLWTEEYVPAEAIFYFNIIGNYQPNKKVYQLGGNTSTGKGFVEVCPYENS